MGSKGSTSTSNTVTEPWEASQPLLKQLLGDTGAQYDAGSFDIQPWPGIRVAPQSGMTQDALQGFADIAGAGNPITPAATQGFMDMMDPSGFGGMDALKANALGEIMPAAMQSFSGAGMLDSSLAADAAGRAATQAIAPIEYGAWQQAQNRKLGALGMTPQLAASQYLDPQMLSMAGQQQDAFNQNVLNAAMGAFGEEQMRPYDELQRAASLAMGFGGMGGTGAQKQGGGSSALGTAGGIVQTVAPLMALAKLSDRRLKRDIRRIGETAEGYPKYTFRYLWDDKVHVGVMADEVPDEITVRHPSGFLMVNYAGVTL